MSAYSLLHISAGSTQCLTRSQCSTSVQGLSGLCSLFLFLNLLSLIWAKAGGGDESKECSGWIHLENSFLLELVDSLLFPLYTIQNLTCPQLHRVFLLTTHVFCMRVNASMWTHCFSLISDTKTQNNITVCFEKWKLSYKIPSLYHNVHF